ncbi:MAG: MBOAT family protein [Pseudomonadota bacterium]
MVFSSYLFLLAFLPAALIGFYALRAMQMRDASVTFLLVASMAFYAHWNVGHLALLVGSIGVNFIIGRMVSAIDEPRARKTVLFLGVCFNLSLIFWFKYFDFAAANLAAATGRNHTLLNLLLPLGISFFTFQQIAYLVDCSRARSCETNLRDYALFVSFFPQLIAGPIVHHNHTRPQYRNLARHPVNIDAAPYGLMIFAIGLGKKALIADPIARGIDPIWTMAAAGDPISAGLAWTAMVGYTLQIYFDFSGYCDMAIGIAALFGIRLPVNFNSPYKSRSIIEFWRRWHITLSNFLRDYVYIPLGGNRGGQFLKLRNIFLTMLIGGVWHGAAWTFILWGAAHAAMITANHALRIWAPDFTKWDSPRAIFLKTTGTLLFVMLAWVLFRADSLGAAGQIYAGLLGAEFTGVDPLLAIYMAGASAIALWARNGLEIAGYEDDLAQPFPKTASHPPSTLQPTPVAAFSTAILLACGLAVAWKPAVFIYFNF